MGKDTERENDKERKVEYIAQIGEKIRRSHLKISLILQRKNTEMRRI